MEKHLVIARIDEIEEGAGKRIEFDGKYIAVFNVGGEFFAIDDTCSHEEASLAQGEVEDYLVECPLHGSRFDVRSGEPKAFPAIMPVKTYKIVVEGDDLIIDIGSE